MASEQAPNPNSLLAGLAPPAAQWESIGDRVTGVINTAPETRQQHNYETGEPLFWPDGKPRWMVVIILDTDIVSDDIEGDDGRRAVYVRVPSNLRTAIALAMRKAGAEYLSKGAKLTIDYVGDGEQKNKKLDPPKLYAAVYEPASASKDSGGTAE